MNNRREFLGAVLAGSLTTAIGCAGLGSRGTVLRNTHCNDGQYDRVSCEITRDANQKSLEESVYPVHAYTKLEIDPTAPKAAKEYFDEIIERVGQDGMLYLGGGSAIALKDNHLLSAKHVFENFERILFLRHGGRYHRVAPTVTNLYIDVNNKLYDVEVEDVATDGRDAVLVKADLSKGMKLQGLPFGKDSQLKPRDTIYVVGNGNTLGIQVKKGFVTRTKPFTVAGKDVSLKFPYEIPGKRFFMHAAAAPGDSGGAVYALRDGKPELVGILIEGWGRMNPGEAALGIEEVVKHLRDPLKKIGMLK
jgi:hypothetical protein